MVKRATHPASVLLVVLAAAALLAACGGGDGSNEEGEGPASASTAGLIETTGLPRPSNRSMRALLQNMRQGPELAPTQKLLEPGRNRFGFGLFDRANRQIGDIKVGLYLSMGLDETAHGPYPVRFERIEIADRYRSRQTAEDPDAATGYYVGDVPFRRPGGYLVSAIAELGNKLVATSPVQVMARNDVKVPGEGDRAIRVSTPTRESVGGDIKRIETRVPPDTMHEVNLADALDDGRPILLLFATPAFCQSRVCGPVTDVAEEVKSEYGDRVDFIHVEIYKDNDPKVVRTRGGGVLLGNIRPQVSAWHLESEPFAFAINSKGVVVERLEGAFNIAELSTAVRKALR
jgi:hypothetical protein